MEAVIQGALVVLSTATAPSIELDGVIDQIVTVGLPMIPVLIATNQSNADATARLLLSGVQRASEHVDAPRKASIIKGIAAHVCVSGALPWPVRAFGVKTLQNIIHSQGFASVGARLRAEAVAACVEAMASIVHVAHMADLSKQFKKIDSSAAPVPHPYHSAEIKSAVDFFALLSEIDAETVASVFAPKQKQHLEGVAAIVSEATAASSANIAVAQAIASRYDLVTLGLPRTVGLRIALEKLNCEALNDLSKTLADSDGATAFDMVMIAYSLFIGSKDGSTAPTQDGSTCVLTEAVNRLAKEQGVSKETINIFLKGQLKDTLARATAELVAADPSTYAAISAPWTQRIKSLSRNGLVVKIGGPLSAILADLVFGLSTLAAHVAVSGEVKDVTLELVRELESYTFRSFGIVDAADVCTLHSRIGEGAEVLLKALFPTTPAESAPTTTNLPLLEAALLLAMAATPRPKKVKSTEIVGEKRERKDEEDGTAEEGKGDASDEDTSAKPQSASDVELFGVQKFIATYSVGAFYESVRDAYSILIEELSTIEVANRLKTLLGDKAPAAVLDGASDDSPFVSVAVLKQRQRVLQGIVTILRGIHSGGAAHLNPSYDLNRRVAERDSSDQHDRHHNGGNGHRQHGRRDTNRRDDRPDDRRDDRRRDDRRDDRDKRHRGEGGRNGDSNRNNGRGYNHTESYGNNGNNRRNYRR